MKMRTPDSASCPKFIDDLERLVDGCMSAEEEKEFLDAIAPSIECVEKLKVERAYKEFLATKLERKCCTQSLLNNIQECTKED